MQVQEVKKIAAGLHEEFRNYGDMQDIEKAVVASACLLAVKYESMGEFNVNSLCGYDMNSPWNTDGEVVYNLIESKVGTQVQSADVILDVFSCLKKLKVINTVSKKLGMTPLKYFILLIRENLMENPDTDINGDCLGIFYSEFMSYSEANRQSLGIVLTPAFITDLFVSLADVKSDDVVLDPCCGTGGFLMSALDSMCKDSADRTEVCAGRIHGYDVQPFMYAITQTNILLRSGTVTDNVQYANFLDVNVSDLKKKNATVGFMNPPYSQGKKDINLTEINFIKHLLDGLSDNARCVCIVPASAFIRSVKTDAIREDIYKHHTLEGVITLNENVFMEISTRVVIAIFTAHVPHPADKICKFINYENDGFEVQPQRGYVRTPMADIMKDKLMREWKDETVSDDDFCVRTKVKADDEWLYGFYKGNLDIPDEKIFDDMLTEYMSFRFTQIISGRNYLFEDEGGVPSDSPLCALHDKKWKCFNVSDVFEAAGAKITRPEKLLPGKYPRVTSSALNNAYEGFYSECLCDMKHASINKGAVITVESAIYGAVYYQPYDFIANPHVSILKSKDIHLDRHTGLFMAGCIKSAIKNKYNYGYKCSLFRLKREKLVLPVDKQGNIDYDYMRSYMKALYERKNKYYRAVCAV